MYISVAYADSQGMCLEIQFRPTNKVFCPNSGTAGCFAGPELSLPISEKNKEIKYWLSEFEPCWQMLAGLRLMDLVWRCRPGPNIFRFYWNYTCVAPCVPIYMTAILTAIDTRVERFYLTIHQFDVVPENVVDIRRFLVQKSYFCDVMFSDFRFENGKHLDSCRSWT